MLPARSRFDLVLEILLACEPGAGITRVVDNCGLCHKTASCYIGDLISVSAIMKDGDFYYTTEKGLDLLARLEAAQRELQAMPDR
jgi:predicted transcriptional regulator